MSLDAFHSWLTGMIASNGLGDWSAPLLTGGAVLAALAVHAIATAILRRGLRNAAPAATLLRRVKGLTRLALVLLAVFIVLPAVETDPAITEMVRRALSVGLIVALGWAAIIAVSTMSDVIAARHRLDTEDNLRARRMITQVNILRRGAILLTVLVTLAAIMMSFPSLRNYGISLFASAGVASVVIGFAARPVLSNLIAGIQIALTQPIRIDDVVIIDGEWGWIEEITSTYIVVRLWDWRRLIVPLTHFIETPFQNWTRENAAIIGSVFWHVDYTVPVEEMRAKVKEFAAQSELWDGRVANLQVTDTSERTMTVRALVSAKDSPKAWDLRCEIREKMIVWLQQHHPQALPRLRAEIAEPAPAPTARSHAVSAASAKS